MPTVLMHTRPLDEKEKIVTGPRVAWLPPYPESAEDTPQLAGGLSLIKNRTFIGA